MKSFEEFKAEVMKWMQEKAKEQEYILSEGQNYKVNQQLDYVSLGKKQNPSCQPVVYVQDMYIAYHEEMEKGDYSEKDIIETVLRKFWDILTSSLKIAQEIPRNLEDKTKLKELIMCQLVNADKNREMLKNMPHREYLDLAIIYRVMFDDESSALVTNGLAGDMGMEEEELYQMARRNLNRILPIKEKIMDSEDDIDMIFISSNFIYGATVLLDTERLGQFAERIRGDFYIILSSIHELIIMPASKWDKEALEVALWEFNRTAIEPDIYLSDTVYLYDSQTKTVRIA